MRLVWFFNGRQPTVCAGEARSAQRSACGHYASSY